MGVARLLLLTTLLQFLPSRGAAGPFPALAPPLTMVVNGQQKQLVACVVSDLPPGSHNAIWISSSNGSALRTFTYGVSRGDNSTTSTISILPADSDTLACHVGPDRTAPAHSSEPLRVAGTALAPAATPHRPRLPQGCTTGDASSSPRLAVGCVPAPAWPRAVAIPRALAAVVPRGTGMRATEVKALWTRCTKGVAAGPTRTPGAGPLSAPAALSAPQVTAQQICVRGPALRRVPSPP
ncbi:pre T-cell antigen receptor alpha isoform X1 [Dromaius novaehollandiae]|uniref:pre T-cell antigen receptor alpha isoform X1 n=1 Tax=Dromaius novaehollandiae TaxID=8790 RepID=UPI000E1E99AD|nr:pre T-cell antigen receptor alpha isoform X4 [Dromaius novaehollandiae]